MLTTQEAIDKLNEMLENPESITKSALRELENQVSVADNIAPEGSTTVLIPKLSIDRWTQFYLLRKLNWTVN